MSSFLDNSFVGKNYYSIFKDVLTILLTNVWQSVCDVMDLTVVSKLYFL